MFFFFNEQSFVAVIGDIRGSKQLEDRKQTQTVLKETLEKVNRKYENDIAAKFVITLGDEFQGLLFDGKNVLKIIQEIKTQMYPVELRYGIGVGKITTDINTEMALGADGPGYYNARAAVEHIRQNEKKNKAILSDIRLEMNDTDRPQVVLINTVFELMKSIEQTWTDRQREIIWDMLKYRDGQKDAADRFHISQSTIQKALVKGKYYTYENAMENLAEILGEIKDT